jgi:hypothetical protein
MDLLACSHCDRRFCVTGVRPAENRSCPRCGGGLALALHGMTSIPLGARWFYPRVGPRSAPTVTAMADMDGIGSKGSA